MDFLDTVRRFSESDPDIGNGLREHRHDFKEQFRFLANAVERRPSSLFPDESQDAQTSDSLLVEAGSGPPFIDDDLDNESGFFDKFLADLENNIDLDSVTAVAATSTLDTHESAPLESSPVPPKLFPAAIDVPLSFASNPSADSLDFNDASILAEISDGDSSILVLTLSKCVATHLFLAYKDDLIQGSPRRRVCHALVPVA
ncbi:hypothetical protein K438DRAFT_1782834 [Mycena galopus ATCC 62051]|nr:hypothetical protein K438DRAFT_1782834 [Mycena galopus ATCC 62051]